MMFIIRSSERPPPASVIVKVVRRTPAMTQGAGRTDYFCIGQGEDIATLSAGGWEIVELRDGWYEDDTGGGVAISGHGKYWEVRDTPFTIKESGGPPEDAGGTAVSDEPVNVRGAVFGV